MFVLQSMSSASEPEKLEPIYDVAERVTGKRPCLQTVWRWTRKRIRGAKLQCVFAGRWCCTESDFRQFIADQTNNALKSSTCSAIPHEGDVLERKTMDVHKQQVTDAEREAP